METIKEKAIRALRWSERYTKTDMVYLTKGGFWLAVGHFMQMAGGLALSIAFANMLPKAVYGTYQFVMSLETIIGGLTLSGLGTALMRSMASGKGGTLAWAFKTQLTWNIGIVVAAGASAIYYFYNGDTEIGAALLIVGTFAPFLSAFNLYRPFLEGKQLFKESTTLGVWRRPIPIISLITALLFTDNPVVLVLVYFISNTVSAGLIYSLTKHRYPEPAETADPNTLKYAKHLSILGFFALITAHLDKILLFHFLGPAPAAIYMIASLPSDQLHKLFGLIGRLVFRKFARHDFETLRKSLSHKFMLFFLAVGAITIVYYFTAPYVFGFIFPKYVEAVFFSQILMLTLLFRPATLFNQVFVAHGLKRAQYFLQLSSNAIKITLLILLIPMYGIWGAVASMLAMYVYWFFAALLLFYGRKS